MRHTSPHLPRQVPPGGWSTSTLVTRLSRSASVFTRDHRAFDGKRPYTRWQERYSPIWRSQQSRRLLLVAWLPPLTFPSRSLASKRLIASLRFLSLNYTEEVYYIAHCIFSSKKHLR